MSWLGGTEQIRRMELDWAPVFAIPIKQIAGHCWTHLRKRQQQNDGENASRAGRPNSSLL